MKNQQANNSYLLLSASGLLFSISALGFAISASHTQLIIFRFLGGIGVSVAFLFAGIFLAVLSQFTGINAIICFCLPVPLILRRISETSRKTIE